MVGFAVAAVIAAMSATTGVASATVPITGAGSTLIAPLMAKWQQHSGLNITYQGVGSGTGIADIIARSVSFGASDAPLTPAQAQQCNGCTQIPWALSATGITFNIPGVRGVKLTGGVVSRIYLGQITNWSDPAIRKLNKKAHLPNLKITPVYRSDGSGDTYAFTNFLSKVSGAWAHRIGFATSVAFPTGVGAAHNSGMVSTVEATSGSIGYIAASFLIQANLPAAGLQNAAGKFEYPNIPNIANAAASVSRLPRNNELHIVYPPKKFKIAYPLSTFTYGIFPNSSGGNASTLQALVRYAVGAGQQYGPALDFAALPKFVKKGDLKAANSLHS
jgi:phosphate transport system substrate-binding protein